MTTSKASSVKYTHLPTNADHENVVVVLPLYYHRHSYRRCLVSAVSVIILVFAVFLLYPSNPEIQLARVHINHVRVNSSHKISLDLSFSVVIKVRNRDFFSLGYETLDISVGYRGRGLGFVKSDGGRVRARTSSYVNATVNVDGLEVVHDVFYLLEDLVKGSIPFDTVTEVKGSLGLFFFKVPMKGKVSCEVLVNVSNQTIMHQDCH